MRIGIIGGGVVGRATARCWLEHCEEVRVYDHVPERSTHSLYDVEQCDIIFVCVPEDRLEDLFRDRLFGTTHNYVLKSTVPIGTTRRLASQYRLPNLVHSPEFLTARCAVTDAQVPARNIIGHIIEDEESFGWKLGDLYLNRFPGITTFHMSSDESEAVKLAVNSFFAVKVAYFNEVWSLCDAIHLDWETVRVGILSDGRVGSSHTQVPGPDGRRGFGGTCLPKDLQHLLSCQDEAKVKSFMVEAAIARNKQVDRRES